MIQLRESDFLWKCYVRYYKSDLFQLPPHPRSVCNFFWKAVGGMFMYVFWDMYVIIAGPMFAIISVLLWLVAIVTTKHCYCVPLFMAALLMTIATITFGTLRWIAYWERKKVGGVVNFSVLSFVVFGICSGMCSMPFSGSASNWQPIHLLYGACVVVGIVGIVVGIVGGAVLILNAAFSKEQVLKSYLESFKSRVCPLVKAPWEEKDDSAGICQPKEN